MVHVALPVKDLVPGAPIFAGRPKAESFEEIKKGYKKIAEEHVFQHECVEGLTTRELSEFMMDPLWKAGVDGRVVAGVWEATERILNHVLGPLQ